MKKAILIISFGTTMPDVREETIGGFERMVAEKYPEYDVFRAFTSRIVIKKIADEEDIWIDTEQAALNRLFEKGYTDVVLQPLHIMAGTEYNKIQSLVETWKSKNLFKSLRFGRPLLYFFGQEGERPDDYAAVLKALTSVLPNNDNEGALLVGHGTMHPSQACYGAMLMKSYVEGNHKLWLCTLEGFPELEELLPIIKASGVKKIKVKPFFFVAGDHVKNDIFGDDEESIVCCLRSAGYEIESDKTGLGQMVSIREIYLEHLDDAINDRYTQRPSHRPYIPNIDNNFERANK